MRSGSRVSTLIDAAQWQGLAVEYAEQVFETGGRERPDEAARARRFTVDVAAEAPRFLPRRRRAALTRRLGTYRRLRADFLEPVGEDPR
ncbi:hypothetical protein [Actinomadura sp. DC4]|uniref:hypothetical protein n=1 Tax=Actinomadura sp. DC4 TaxID=3055069 RepID=UPI0025B154FC|nr:hypothetical protein [Actinomadura sp. DC4]MDN3355405.1 hypothetical protein [Actinomadura sp. DC4]